MSKECTFCQPEELAPRILNDSSELVLSFLSSPRMAKGHSIVIPRRHVEPGVDSLSNDEIIAIEREAERLRVRMLKLGYIGVDSFQKTRPLIPEGTNDTKMDHLHQHVIPSSLGSSLYSHGLNWGYRELWHKPSPKEQTAMQEALRP